MACYIRSGVVGWRPGGSTLCSIFSGVNSHCPTNCTILCDFPIWQSPVLVHVTKFELVALGNSGI